MATINFVAGSIGTPITADWLNDLDAFYYETFNGATSAALARTALSLGDSALATIGTGVQAWDAGLDALAALAVTDGNFIVGNGSTWVAESGATVRTSLGLGDAATGTIGVQVQAYDADTLKSDTTATLTTGYDVTASDQGTKSSGTFTPEPSTREFQYIINGGAFTLAPPTETGSFLLTITNNASAGTITTSGFGDVFGDTLVTTDTYKFMCLIINDGTNTVLKVKALQ